MTPGHHSRSFQTTGWLSGILVLCNNQTRQRDVQNMPRSCRWLFCHTVLERHLAQNHLRAGRRKSRRCTSTPARSSLHFSCVRPAPCDIVLAVGSATSLLGAATRLSLISSSNPESLSRPEIVHHFVQHPRRRRHEALAYLWNYPHRSCLGTVGPPCSGCGCLLSQRRACSPSLPFPTLREPS